MARGLAHMIYEGVRELQLFLLENRKLKGDFTVGYNYPVADYRGGEATQQNK